MRLPMTPSKPLGSTWKQPETTHAHGEGCQLLRPVLLGLGPWDFGEEVPRCGPNPFIMPLCIPCGHGRWQRSDGVVGPGVCALQQDLPRALEVRDG